MESFYCFSKSFDFFKHIPLCTSFDEILWNTTENELTKSYVPVLLIKDLRLSFGKRTSEKLLMVVINQISHSHTIYCILVVIDQLQNVTPPLNECLHSNKLILHTLQFQNFIGSAKENL